MNGPKTPSEDAAQPPPEPDPSDALAGPDQPAGTTDNPVDAGVSRDAMIDNPGGENPPEGEKPAESPDDAEDEAISRTMNQLYRED